MSRLERNVLTTEERQKMAEYLNKLCNAEFGEDAYQEAIDDILNDDLCVEQLRDVISGKVEEVDSFSAYHHTCFID